MLKTVTLRKLEPWPQFNEYEGEVVVEVDGRELTCHVVMSSKDAWRTHRPGEALKADLWLDRDRTWEKARPTDQPFLRHVAGVHYELLGKILDLRGERLTVDAGLVLSVDLEADAAAVSTLAVGDKVRAEGSLTIDLEPE